MTIAIDPPPALDRISSDDKKRFLLFYQLDGNRSAKRQNLGKVVELANKACSIIERTNPILQEGSPQTAVIPGRQWQLNRLSLIKQIVARKIICKREYYENHWFGRITKFFLKCFKQWNDGDTAAIVKAEDFLIFHDIRLPLYKNSKGLYQARFFFPTIPLWWVRQNLVIDRFFNYNPRRAIPVVQNFRYELLNPTDPHVFI